MIGIMFLILLTISMVITYFREEKRMIEEYKQMADGLTNLMIEAVNPDRIDEYIEENYSSREYLDIMKYFYDLKHNYPDVYYMYIYSYYKGDVPSATRIIDLEEEYTENPNQDSIDWVGSTYTVAEPFASRIDEILTGSEPVFETVHDGEDGYLLSFAKSFFDEDGNYIATACVDFSMQEMYSKNIRFTVILSAILILVGLVVLVLFTVFVLQRTITKPLLSISDAVSGFKHDTEADCTANLEALQKIGLNSDNEIGVLYDALMKAEAAIHDQDVMITELGAMALRDSMTNVGNKTAFTRSISALRDTDEYGIVLMDVNNLKKINDTYGHEAGDAYIKGCCQVLCDTFAHSPVFRIGGDEFAVILKGQDFKNRHDLMEQIEKTLDLIWREKEYDPLRRYSCALGMADTTTCNTPRETIKTADDIMYANKKALDRKSVV